MLGVALRVALWAYFCACKGENILILVIIPDISVINANTISASNIGLIVYECHSSLYSDDLYDNIQYNMSMSSHPKLDGISPDEA